MGRMANACNRVLSRTLGYELVAAAGSTRDRMMLDHLRALGEARRRPLSPDLQARLVLLGRLLTPRRATAHRKVRLGGRSDGGYVMLDDFDRLRTALSLGVGPNVDWDAAVAERGIAVHMFDHTVGGPPRRHRHFNFHRTRVDAAATDGAENLASLLDRYGSPDPHATLLKVDIEGSEWGLFAEAEDATLSRFPQILCEFHAVGEVQSDGHYRLMMRALSRLRRHFDVVHLHGNNFGGRVFAGEQAIPQFLEVTFVHRDLYPCEDAAEEFPSSIDVPNDPGRPDLYLGAFRFDAARTHLPGHLEALAAIDAEAAGFDGQAYLAANPDVAAAAHDAWTHWRLSGRGEGRPMSLEECGFDPDAYLAANPDVAWAGFDALTHWRHFGRREARPLTPRQEPDPAP